MPNIVKIRDLSDPSLSVYAHLTERELMHPQHGTGIFIAESPKVIDRALDAGYRPLSLLMEEKHVEGQAKHIIERCGTVPVYISTLDVLTSLTGFALTRGVLCAMERRSLPAVNTICSNAYRVAVLEDIMNPTNLGAVFRSAAALNVDAVLLTPGCCDPLYRRSVRVSMGTVFQIPWTFLGKERSDWPKNGMQILHTMGFQTAALALRSDALSVDSPVLMKQERLALVLGTEGEGLAESTIAACDYTVRIPMSHGVDSLNVAAAAAVAFWQLCNRINGCK